MNTKKKGTTGMRWKKKMKKKKKTRRKRRKKRLCRKLKTG